MKRYLIGFVVLFIIIFTSCATTSSGNNEPRLIGQWLFDPDGKAFFTSLYDFKTSTKMEFVFSFDGEKWGGKSRYRIEGNKIYFSNKRVIGKSYSYIIFDLDTPDVLKLKLEDQNTFMLFHRIDIHVEEFQTLEKADSIESVLENASKKIIASLSKNKNIAISNVSAEEKEYSDFIINELEVILLDAGFVVLDRSQLDVIRQEQNLQLSGAVADNEIISIGKFSGASYVITGSIDGTGPTRRLRLRLLDIETARVITAVSERF
jgi:TolB-like protein